MITRSALARYIVDTVETDRDRVVSQVAAWLVSNKRSREAEYVVQDVAQLLQVRGQVWAKVTVARPLDDSTEQQTKSFIKQATRAKEVSLDVVVDARRVGGVQIDTPLGSLDASVRAQLNDLVQGVKHD